MFYTYAYIDTQKHNVDYIGKTNNLQRRDNEHRTFGELVFDKRLQSNPDRWKMIPLSYHESEDEAYRMEEALYKIHEPRFTYNAGNGFMSNTNHIYWGESKIDKAGGFVRLMHEKNKPLSLAKVANTLGVAESRLRGWLEIRNLKWSDIPSDNSYDDLLRKEQDKKRAINRNTTGYLYVSNHSSGGYRYRHTVNGKKYELYAKTLEELEQKVKAKNLKWSKI